MSAERFMDQAEEILRRIRHTQMPAIKEAAALIASSIAQGGALHYYDSGHCTGELLGRAGGLFGIHPIRINISVEHPKPPRAGDEAPARGWYQDERVMDFVLDQCHLKAGDVLLLTSVTGSSAFVVELALGVQRRGLKVVSITSPTYSQAISSQHPSGRFLYQIADVVIDNCGVAGDAALEMPGLDTPACPTSGLAFVTISWALFAQLLQDLLARSITPHIYKSINMPQAAAFNAAARAAYEETGI